MRTVVCVLLTLVAVSRAPDDPALAARLFERGQTFQQFLDRASAQRAEWLATAARAEVAPAHVARLTRVRDGVRLLVVTEDWCVDSVHTVPYIARLAAAAAVELRIVGRDTAAALLARHPTRDGRPATPTVVVIRNGRDAGAWVERPAPLQQWFFQMATDPGSARRFAQRAKWYEEDRGKTTLDEVIAVIGASSPP